MLLILCPVSNTSLIDCTVVNIDYGLDIIDTRTVVKVVNDKFSIFSRLFYSKLQPIMGLRTVKNPTRYIMLSANLSTK